MAPGLQKQQKYVRCSSCGWKTRRKYNEISHGFGSCCNESCDGVMRKIPSYTELKRAAVHKEMSQR